MSANCKVLVFTIDIIECEPSCQVDPLPFPPVDAEPILPPGDD